MDIELAWHGTAVPALEVEVVTSIREELLEAGGLKAAEDLLFHSVQLGPDIEGPEVMVWGVKGDHRFHCEYHSTFQGIKFEKSDMPEAMQKLLWPDEETDS